MNSSEHLVQAYKQLRRKEQIPNWAFEIEPSVPFVDPNSYGGLLIYGSAESLSYYSRQPSWPNWLKSEVAWNRHQYWFERWCSHSDDARRGEFFPYFHIEPFSQGLLVAAAFIASTVGMAVDPDPSRFARTLAVANLGKFSVAAKTNVDYAGDWTRLVASVPYLEVDQSILKPRFTFLAHSSWKVLRPRVPNLFSGTSLVPAMQFQGHNFRRAKQNFPTRGLELMDANKDQPWTRWIEHLDGRRKAAIWFYLSEVEAGLNQGGSR